MDFDLKSKFKEFDKMCLETPSKVQYMLDLTKESNIQALNTLNSMYTDWETEIEASKSANAIDSQTIQALEEEIHDLESKLFYLKEKLDELNLLSDEKLKIIEKIIPPDISSITKEKNTVENEIKMISQALKLQINISKIKWEDLQNGLKGKVLKDNLAIPFEFSSDQSSDFEICNELWKLLGV